VGIFGGRKATMARWVASKRSIVEQIPRPTDYPQAHTDGPDADRVLIFGSGVAVGWGTTSYAEALPGRLAAALSDLTTRGTDVDVIVKPDLTIAQARNTIVGSKLWRFDVIVLSVGRLDALLLTDPDDWRVHLAALLAEVEHTAAEGTRILLLGIDPVGSIAAFDGPKAAWADAHAAVLNAISEELCAAVPTVSFVRLASDPTDYTAVGLEIGDAIIDDLNAARNELNAAVRGPAGQDAAERERERQAGVDSVGILDTPDDDRYDRIVTMAR